MFQLTHVAEMRHKEHDHHYTVVVSTFIIWSKFNAFQPYCRKNFSIVKELKVVATFIRNINENQLVFPGGIEPLGSFQLIYAVSLEG